MSPEERQQLEDLVAFKKNLEADTTIPFEVAEAMRVRVHTDELATDTTSKSLTSEQHAGGAAGLKNPEVWLEVTIDGVRHFVPAYTA